MQVFDFIFIHRPRCIEVVIECKYEKSNTSPKCAILIGWKSTCCWFAFKHNFHAAGSTCQCQSTFLTSTNCSRPTASNDFTDFTTKWLMLKVGWFHIPQTKIWSIYNYSFLVRTTNFSLLKEGILKLWNICEVRVNHERKVRWFTL